VCVVKSDIIVSWEKYIGDPLAVSLIGSRGDGLAVRYDTEQNCSECEQQCVAANESSHYASLS